MQLARVDLPHMLFQRQLSAHCQWPCVCQLPVPAVQLTLRSGSAGCSASVGGFNKPPVSPSSPLSHYRILLYAAFTTHLSSLTQLGWVNPLLVGFSLFRKVAMEKSPYSSGFRRKDENYFLSLNIVIGIQVNIAFDTPFEI